jgi:flagellar hook-associated protein 1 FlgK
VNPDLVSDSSGVRAGASGAPGDGNLALQIAQLKDKEVTISGQANTLGGWYAGTVTQLGSDSLQARVTVTRHDALVAQLEARRDEVSGVSLDEEAANMIRFERAYQASARMMTAIDQMLETLINQMGLVGR